MPKRIVVCFDGTWNTPSETYVGLKALHARFAALGDKRTDEIEDALEHVEAAGAVETNVCRFYRSVRRLSAADAPDGIAQAKWYDKGVGTEWYNRFGGGAFGLGLSRNIRQGYRYLSQVWEEGDEVFILGFSRGAYTARSLVGMIRNCGLLPRSLTEGEEDGPEIMEAYEIYRTRDGSADSERAISYRKRKGSRLIPIKFLGVWDTVGALGIPVQSFEEFNREQFQFHDTELSAIVENAFHAIAVDEHRQPYAATLWDPKAKPRQTIEQRWFVGAHADVGGGYESRDLSDITLRWMQEKAQARGLTLDPRGIPDVRNENALADLADSFAAFLGGIFRFFQERYYRPIGRCIHGQEIVDETVRRRLETDRNYRPRNGGLR
jgi:uncharacterized protein (DUF2235 family)